MTAIAFSDSFSTNRLFQATGGVSEEAFGITEHLAKVFNRINDTASKAQRPISVISQLIQIEQECSENGWDGYDATAINDQTLNNTLEFTRSLNESLPTPEICPEPDGELAIEWFGVNGATISISIGKTDNINFSAIFPDQYKANGTDSSKNENKGIIEMYIKKVLGIE